MTTSYSRIGGTPEVSPPERRRYARQAAWAEVRLRSAQGDECEAVLTDVTAHGCSLRCDAGWLRTGAFVTIKLDEDPELAAIVRWLRDGSAGLELLRAASSEHALWHGLLSEPYGI